ncbi:MAG: class I SAM-dependent RNA methyltransferase [Candidatus Izimaplasma sp.]|nr:class I SAM-dependent RNA methyltransferase [Candidatus Izimaplasma bacterium]
MQEYECIATTSFGLEAVCKREIIELGFKIKKTENGKITFFCDKAGIAKANLWLRSADRVLLKMGEFNATTFDQLFDQINQISWHSVIDKDGKFTVLAKSVKSKLFSKSDIQAIVKKAIVEEMKTHYNTNWFEESGAPFTVLVSILKDKATVTLDTSGDGLHKRGYRVRSVKAPLKETLAAALVLLSFWDKSRVLYDPFCGSGTIPIEAAMLGLNIAPGLNRDFASKHWKWMGKDIWKEAIREAFKAIDQDIKLNIYASDLNADSVEAAKANAFEAGVDEHIQFDTVDARKQSYNEPYGIIITNPPYGERLLSIKSANQLYEDLGNIYPKLESYSIYIISANKEFEAVYGKTSNKRRKLYNGRIETWFYQYYGPKPQD